MFRLRLPLLASWALVSTTLCAGAAMMVTDVAGQVQLGDHTPVRLMDGLPARQVLTLSRTGRVALLDLATGVESVFQGPCRFHFDAQGQPQGARPVATRQLATAQGPLRLKADSLVPAGILMRGGDGGGNGARLQVAPCGPLVLEASPLLSWQAAAPGARTRFRLYDDSGTLRQERAVEGTSIRLPALEPGKPYTWVLEADPVGEPPRVASGIVKVMDAPSQAQLARMRPAAGAAFSERLVFAALLEELGLRSEAQGLWQALTLERPSDGRLQALAGRRD